MLTTVLANPVLANTEPHHSNQTPVKKVKSNFIKKIVIHGDVDVILISGEATGVTIDGNKKVVEKVKLVYQHDNLEILAPHYLHSENNPVIRIRLKAWYSLK